MSAPRVNHAWSAAGSVAGSAPADLVGQLEHRRRAQPTVEVVVQQDLGRGPDRVGAASIGAGIATAESPLRYGMPSAAGGRSRWANSVTTMSVTTYGVM